MPHIEDLTIEKGRNFKFIFTFFEDKSKLKPLNLTGLSFKSECRSGDSWQDSLLFPFVCAIEDAVSGKMSISVSYIDTKALSQVKGFYDITELTTVKTFAKGEITFTPSATEIP